MNDSGNAVHVRYFLPSNWAGDKSGEFPIVNVRDVLIDNRFRYSIYKKLKKEQLPRRLQYKYAMDMREKCCRIYKIMEGRRNA